jgi:hypothetical protein
MPMSPEGLNVAANAWAAATDNARLHTGDPGANGTNNVATSGLEAVTWGAASAGDVSLTGTPIDFTGGAASGPCTHVSFWDGVPGSGGVHMGSYALTGDQTFNAAGEYSLDSGTIDFD